MFEDIIIYVLCFFFSLCSSKLGRKDDLIYFYKLTSFIIEIFC